MDGEMRHHIELETVDLIAHGWEPEAARREAVRRFGGLEQMKELGRDARGTRSVEDFAADVRYAWRVLRRDAALSISGAATLALGICATAAILSLVYGVLLRPLPYRDAGRVVVLWESDSSRKADHNVVSLDNFEAWQRAARSFSAMAAVIPTSATFTDGDFPERVVGAEVTAGYFSLLGIAPALGRGFGPVDEQNTQAILLSDAYWRRRFAADPAVIGRVRVISGKAYTIVGVLPAFEPPRMSWLGTQDLWFPMPRTDERRSWGRSLIVLGRLADGVTIDQARSEMAGISARLSRERSADRGWSSNVVPLPDEIAGSARPTLLVLLAGAGVMLAIAVLNVTTLTLASIRRRGSELAMRRAIGATDRRLFRQLFTQSALLSLLGAAGGVAAAPAAVQAILRLAPSDLPRAADVQLDVPVLLITVLIALAAILIVGAASAFRGRDAGHLVHTASRTTAVTKGSGALITCEVALALTIGVAAVLMARSLGALNRVELGFASGGVLAARVSLPLDRYSTAAAQRAFFDGLLDRVRRAPGVEAAGMMSARPLSGMGPATTAHDPHAPVADRANDPVADVRTVSADVVDALGFRLTAGRRFAPALVTGPPEMIVTNDFAQRMWPGGNAIGRQLFIDMYGGLTGTIVGVVAPIHLFDARTAARPLVLLSSARFPDVQRDLIVRSATPALTVSQLRSILADADRTVPLYRVSTLTQLIDETTAPDRFATFLLCAFAVSALALAGVGVFGVFAADVAARRREIGIRIALGSTPARLLAGASVRALRRTLLGIACGVSGALVLARAMRALLFGVEPTDLPSFLSVAAVMMLIALAATLVPSARALRRHPLEALREE